MGAAKELWMAEVELIEDQICGGVLSIEEGVAALRRKGFDKEKAESMARVAAGEEP